MDRADDFYHDESGERFQEIYRTATQNKSKRKNSVKLWILVIVGLWVMAMIRCKQLGIW